VLFNEWKNINKITEQITEAFSKPRRFPAFPCRFPDRKVGSFLVSHMRPIVLTLLIPFDVVGLVIFSDGLNL